MTRRRKYVPTAADYRNDLAVAIVAMICFLAVILGTALS